MKQVIFNVGGALATYTEFRDKKLVVDIGKSKEFSPTNDFLLPLYKKRENLKSNIDKTKYHVDQLIISHPHDDHLSDISEFNDKFYPELLTCPNDNDGMQAGHHINWKLLEKNPNVDILRKMLNGRKPPLKEVIKDFEYIYYIPPRDCEQSNALSVESYCNNISIAVFLIINDHRIFLPGDLQKTGMDEIISRNQSLKTRLAGGVDILIAPHHGLQSSFSTVMFDYMKNKKTRCLNIVSEKVNTNDKRNVDSRYSTSDYCFAKNDIGEKDEPHYQVKTSRGHIFIDYGKNDYPRIEIINDTELLIKKFL
ncbi:MAG: beta-lactamase domain protein [Haloplasmataceae bacterium]|jgi:beta-lactamase superfamily II metal-dependent hydrolase|nr:beta-lactamase domain protein [Haloplasmataceae bacterium]